ncbi:MAG: hypothetical protein EOP34_09075, partial [Rickettsiales bacterium]
MALVKYLCEHKNISILKRCVETSNINQDCSQTVADEILNLLKIFNTACEFGHKNIVIYVYDNFLNNIANKHLPLVKKSIDKAFVNSISYRQNKIAKYLYKIGANINYDNNKALLIASSGNLDGVKFLCKNGIDVQCSNNQAIIVAASCNKLAIVKCLVKYGADCMTQENEAIILASANGNIDVVKYLIKLGANP